MKKDYIGWIIGIFGIIVSIIYGMENKKLTDNKLQIHNSAQNIQQFIVTNNYNLPPTIEKEIQNIKMASGPTVETRH